jgi:hypothetical protein
LTHRVNSFLPLPDGVDNFADCINHELRLLFVYSWPLFVLVMCFSFGTSFVSRSCAFFLCGIDDVAEVGRHVGW